MPEPIRTAPDGADIDRRLEEIRERYPDTAEAIAANVARWRSGGLPLVDAEALHAFLTRAPIDLVQDSFWRQVPFGTGGVRGTIGFGPNRINPTTIALTAQAHCTFIRANITEGPARVVVANDVRTYRDAAGLYGFLERNPLVGVSSRSMARLVAEVYAANGFEVHMCDPDDDAALLTTPELSFLIRVLDAVGGVNMSASHNPPDDNGIKVYDAAGGQYLPPHDERLAAAAGDTTDVARVPFAEARSEGRIVAIAEEHFEAYRREYLDALRADGLRAREGATVVFTPLNGCGGRTVPPVLEGLGFQVVIPEGQGPDGTFANIPLLAPNPEVVESTAPARADAERAGIGIVLSADPDADRLGVDVFHDGRWVHLTGNQIATVIAYFLMLDPAGPQKKGPVYQTLVTTLAVPKVAELAGSGPVVDDLLVGFKYIGGAIAEREARGETPLLVFAAEESHGYLVTPNLRDKDAVSAAVYLALVHDLEAADGGTLVDYLERVYEHIGTFGDQGRSLVLRGSAGVEAIGAVMRSLRADPPTTVGGIDVSDVADHWDTARFGEFSSSTARDARNVLVVTYPGGRMTIRPSGTEPKLKYYVQTTPDTPGADVTSPQVLAEAIAADTYNLMLERIGRSLSRPALLLPDVLSVDAKERFDSEVLPLLASGDAARAAEQVRAVLGELVPGSDPIPSCRAALRAALDERAAAGVDVSGLRTELQLGS